MNTAASTGGVMKRHVCSLCGEYTDTGRDHPESFHDGDGMEPCVHGHYGCSMSGKTGGPCANEYNSEHPEEVE